MPSITTLNPTNCRPAVHAGGKPVTTQDQKIAQINRTIASLRRERARWESPSLMTRVSYGLFGTGMLSLIGTSGIVTAALIAVFITGIAAFPPALLLAVIIGAALLGYGLLAAGAGIAYQEFVRDRIIEIDEEIRLLENQNVHEN